MPERGNRFAWERVLLRHIVRADRTDLERLGSLVHAPFDRSGLDRSSSGDDLKFIPPPTGRWMIAARFAGQPWLSLFSGDSGRQLFDANAKSRRMEVAWVGCQPEGLGWFVRIHRAGKAVVEFAQGVQEGATPTLNSAGIEPGFLRDGETGEQSFRRVCTHFEVTLPAQEVRATDRGFAVVGANGRRVKSALRGYLYALDAAIATGEDAASDALAEAIDRCDADGIAVALKRGASLITRPDHLSVSPLLSMLYNSSKCSPETWEACLGVLLAGGCPVNGTAPANPPILDCVESFIPDGAASKMVAFLISHGADVNATGFRGETALFHAVFNRRTSLVRLLLRHGADPRIKPGDGRSTLEWLHWRVGETFDAKADAQYAELLDMVTASSSD